MNKNRLIPELRFPEYKNKGEWKIKSIDDLCDILNNIRKPITSGERRKGSYPYYGASGIIDFVDDYLFDEKLLLIGEDGAKWGAYENTAFLVEGKYWVNNHAHVLKPNLINDKLLESYLVKLDLHPYITGAAPPKLTLGKLKEIPVPIPDDEIEQQKIASCLSSLDEVIAAHSQKLVLLKDHKKGLMQNLFPQMSGTGFSGLKDEQDEDKILSIPKSCKSCSDNLPKYRFKEFEKDGEWVEMKLGAIGEPLMCKRIFKEQTTTNPKNGIPFYKIGTFGRSADSYIQQELYDDFKSKYSFPNNGDILISAAGTIGRLVVYDGSPAYFQDSNIVWLGNDEQIILNCFLFHCYTRLKWQTSDGGIISRLYNSDLKNMSIKYPKEKKEQQKIASCLSSLDALIAAQADKIEQLKLHKKGLMQGLFPVLNPSNSIGLESGGN